MSPDSVTVPPTPLPPTLTASHPHCLTGRGQIYVAKHRYEAIGPRSNRVLSFEKGEELEVLNPALNSDWWEAISLRTGNKGDVPASYLVRKFGGGGVEEGEEPVHRLSLGAVP